MSDEKFLIARNRISKKTCNFCEIHQSVIENLMAFEDPYLFGNLQEAIFCDCTDTVDFNIKIEVDDSLKITANWCDSEEASNFFIDYSPSEKIKKLYYCSVSPSLYHEISFFSEEIQENIPFCFADSLDYYEII